VRNSPHFSLSKIAPLIAL
jgi:hypothetical protein